MSPAHTKTPRLTTVGQELGQATPESVSARGDRSDAPTVAMECAVNPERWCNSLDGGHESRQASTGPLSQGSGTKALGMPPGWLEFAKHGPREPGP